MNLISGAGQSKTIPVWIQPIAKRIPIQPMLSTNTRYTNVYQRRQKRRGGGEEETRQEERRERRRTKRQASE